MAVKYGRKGYRRQSVLKRAIGEVKAGGAPSSGSFNNIPAIIAAFPVECAEIVFESAAELIAFADARAPRGETGKLATEVKTSVRDTKGGVTVRIEWVAASDAAGLHKYPWYVEVGTVDTAAQPFVVPSIMDERHLFHARLRDLESRLPAR
jgi:hypothetical protein